MSAILLPTPWTKQPQYRAGINRENPFGRILVYAHNFALWNQNAAQVQYTSVTVGTTREGIEGSLGRSFNGSTDVIYITGIPFIAQFSWAGRVTLGSTIETSPYGAVAGRHTTNGNPSDWFLYWSPVDSKFHVDIPWVAGDVFTSTGTYSAGTTYSLLFTRSGTTSNWTYRLYVNGVLDREMTGGTSNPNTSAHNFQLGALNSSADNAANQKYVYSYLFDGVITDAKSLHDNPWQVFEPLKRRIFFQSSSGPTPLTATLDAAIQTARSATATLNGVIQTSGSSTATLDGVIRQAMSASTTLNAAIQAAMSASGTLDAVITTGAATAHTVTLNAAIQEAKSLTATLNAVIQTSGSASASLNAVIVQANSSTATLDATIQAAVTAFALLDAYIFDADAPVVETTTVQAAGRGRRRRYIMPDDSVVIATPSEAEQLVKLFVKPVPPKKPPKKTVKALKVVDLVEIEEVSSDTVPTEKITVKKKAVWERSDLYDQAIKLLAEREILRRRREEEMILLAA